MAEMTPFTYGEFYDVPRCISLRYRGRQFLLQSAFNKDLDEYPMDYSVYLVPETADESRLVCSPEFLSNTPMVCIGKIPVDQVVFDPSKRNELDASILHKIVADQASSAE